MGRASKSSKAPVTTAPPSTSSNGSMITEDKLLQGLAKAESKNVAALAFSAQQQTVQRKKDVASSRSWRIATFLTLFGIVGFFVGNIYIRKYQYPGLFKWYANMRKRKLQGGWKIANYSMYQVTTVMQFEPVGSLLSLFTVWATLPRVGAEFLAKCVTQFGDKLTALHWNGTASQTNASMLIGDTGWASCGCGGTNEEGGTALVRKNKLLQNWKESGAVVDKAGEPANIWYDIFPDPFVNPTGFWNLCVFREIWEPDGSECAGAGTVENMCEGDNEMYKSSHIWQLFDGGLCKVAYKVADTQTSSQELYAYYFDQAPEVPMSCGASYAAGAVSGATSACSSMLAVAAIAPGPGFIIAAMGLTATASVAGAITGGAAAKEACRTKAAEDA